MSEPKPPNAIAAARNDSVGLKAYLDDIADVVKRVPAAWVRCELHALKIADRYVKMEFIEVDAQGKQIAKVQGGRWPAVWQRIDAQFKAAGLALEAGSQVLVKLEPKLDATFGFQVDVKDIDLTFALGDLNARMQAIRKNLQDARIWSQNRSLPPPADFVRVSVIAPAQAAGLGDFRSTADRLVAAGLAEFVYYEVPFQSREAPAKIVDALRDIYRAGSASETRSCAVAIIRGGGASADLTWLVDQKLAEAICRMNVPVMTGIGHAQDRNLLDEIACIPCDTPSKVVERISSTITRAALDGRRAVESIRTQAGQIVSRSEAAVSAAGTAIERDARETVRLAEATVLAAATGLKPRVRALLDRSHTVITSAQTTVDHDARETLRLAEVTVRTAAKGLEPGARALLDRMQGATVAAAEEARAAARQCREFARQTVTNVRGAITLTVETMIRPLELGTAKAAGEITTWLNVLPRSASDEVVHVHRQIASDAERAVAHVGERITEMRNQAIQDASRSLDGCEATIAIVRERAEALDPRSVLAAGYAVLRDRAGKPLTNVGAVRKIEVITAEMRDGATSLINDQSNNHRDEMK